MKNIVFFAMLFLLGFAASVTAQDRVTTKDLHALEGRWTGTLTYIDYRSGRPTVIKSNLIVTKDSDRKWNFAYEYPDEPKANSASAVLLEKDGSTFNDQSVESRKKVAGVTEIVTSKAGTDNDKPAKFRYTYSIGKSSFSIKKEVRLDGTDKYFERNTYSWTR